MPHRLLKVIPYPFAWLTGLFSGVGSTFLAFFTPEQAASAGLAILALLAVLAQPALNAYKQWRKARREEDDADAMAEADRFTRLARELGLTQAKLEDAMGQIDKLKGRQAKVATVVKESVLPAVQALDNRVAAVENAQGSSSNLNFPATPPETERFQGS